MATLNNLKRLAYFAAVVESGSFTAAAERLGITKSVVSQQVARLERESGAALLIRTTRKVQPTAAGQQFYVRCARLLRDAEEAFDELAAANLAPNGVLRLTAPFDYGISVVVPAMAAFQARYPDCKVDAAFSDQTLDLMYSGIELAIRVGWLTQDHIQARQIATFRQRLVAAPGCHPGLLAAQVPADLAALPFVANTALSAPERWQFTHTDGRVQAVQVQASLAMDATLAVREAVRHGAGLSVLPDYVIAEDLLAGRLLEVLPGWQLPQGGIYAVFPTTRFRPAKVRAFVDELVTLAAQH